MKTKFAFDSMEYDFSNINEESIIENTGVDTERVVKRVMTAAKSNKKSRRFSHKVVLGLAAAVASLAVIGTVSVGAAGGFNQVFGDWFAGQPKYGLFSGDHLSSTSEKLNIDFQGIAGDDNFVGAAMTIQNKDGSNFVDNADGTFVLYGSNDVNVTLSPIASLLYDNSNRGGSVWYTLEDEKTIKATAVYNDDNRHLKGEKMTIKENELTAFRLEQEVGDISNSFEELTKKYENQMHENQTIFLYSDSGRYEDNRFYIATEYHIPLNFELNVTLNYKTISRTMEVTQGKELAMNGVQLTINHLDAKSFGMDINATIGAITFPEEPNYDNMNEIEEAQALHDYINALQSKGFMIKFDITMKDGSKLTAKADSRMLESNSETSSTGTIRCQYLQNNSFTAIDPDQIDSITATAQSLTEE